MTTIRPSEPDAGPAVPARPPALVGLAAAVALAVPALLVAARWPVVGAPVVAVLLGVALSRPLGARLPARGLALARGPVLQLAVVLLGAQLSLGQAASVGVSSLPVMLGTLTVCFTLARWLGRRWGVDRDLRTMIGVGTGICGASAIAAVSPVLRARGSDVSYALSTIFAFNVAAVLLFPLLGHALGLDQQQFGLFAGTAVNDTSSVVAAATVYGSLATHHAVVVKLTRSLMIVPVTLALGVMTARRDGADGDGTAPGDAPRRPLWRLVPWFLGGFLVLSLLRTVGALPAGLVHELGVVAPWLIAVALAGIGLSTDVAGLRRAGVRPMLLGATLWASVTVTSLGLQQLVG